MNHPPTVTVLLSTYNHERFIAQALESVLAQRTPFEVATVVLEDRSTDRTREILREIAAREPGRVRLRLAERNVCSNAPLARELESTRSPYVALLDGDDFWTSPDKLRRQVEFLESRPECAICFHDATVLFEDESRQLWSRRLEGLKPVSSLADLLARNFIPGPSPMLRRHVLPQLPEWFDGCVFGDWPLYLLYAQHGDIGYVPEDLATYRFHRGGLWTGLDEQTRLERLVGFLQEMESRLDESYRPTLRRAVEDWGARLEELNRLSSRAAP